MKDILVLAYTLSPTRGSEYSVAWNYVMHMSQRHRLTVLYGASGEHLGDTEEMERYTQVHHVPNVRFIPVHSTKTIDWLNALNRKGLFVYSFYLAYKEWQKQAFKVAQQLVKENKYDLIHYLNPIGYREPGYLWKLDLPYLWGPIGGLCNYPWRLFDSLTWEDKLKYSIRNIINTIQLHTSTRVRKAMKRTDLLLVSTTETGAIVRKVFHKDYLYLPENGLTERPDTNLSHFTSSQDKIRLACIGTLDGRKNFITLLKALLLVPDRNNLHVDIVGDGKLRNLLTNFVSTHGLQEIVTFHGQVSRQEAVDIFKHTHLHIITSIGEGNTTVIWEAMSHGVPTLTLDHCGMHDTVTPQNGYKIAVTNTTQIIHDIAKTLQHILEHPQELQEKSHQVLIDSEKYLWENRVAFFETCYDQCIINHEEKNRLLSPVQ